MSWPDLSEDTITNAMGESDQSSMAPTASAFPKPIRTLCGRKDLPLAEGGAGRAEMRAPRRPSLCMARHLSAEKNHIAGAEDERGQHHQPGRGRRGAERVEAKGFLVEIHRDDLGRAGRASLRHQPYFGEDAKREDVAEEESHRDRRAEQRQRHPAE